MGKVFIAGVAGSMTALALVAGAVLTNHVDINQNESAVKTVNGVITEDNVGQGRYWLLPSWTNTVNDVRFPRISHTQHTVSITAADKGAQCDKDCVNLQTGDQQTVAGALGVLWHISRDKLAINKEGVVVPKLEDGSKPRESVMAELYRVRGATSTEDVQEKLLVPQVLDCMIGKVNKTNAKDLIEKDQEVIKDIRECVELRVAPYNINIDGILNRGFGPSMEARQSMKAFADARQRGQVADVELETAGKRNDAAKKNASIQASAYAVLEQAGIPKEQIPTLLCLQDPGSAYRPCVPLTANGGAAGYNIPSGAH